MEDTKGLDVFFFLVEFFECFFQVVFRFIIGACYEVEEFPVGNCLSSPHRGLLTESASSLFNLL
jgi:hypothetical protein